jgi:hypothetical protein
MAYRIAAIDVHKKMLAVVVADVEGEGSISLSGASSAPVPSNCRCWRNGWWSRGRGSSNGIDRAVLEAGMGGTGVVLEAGAGAAGRGNQDVRQAALVPGQIQPGAARTKERFRRRRTDDQTADGAGTGFELCTGSGTAAVANGNAAQKIGYRVRRRATSGGKPGMSGRGFRPCLGK